MLQTKTDHLWTSTAGTAATCPFREIFSALWHWSPPPTNEELTMSDPNSSVTSSAGSTEADYDSHRLAVQYAIGCTSTFDRIAKIDLKLFVEKFGQLEGSPPICVLRARSSLVVDLGNGRSELVRWYHGDISRSKAQSALTAAASQGGTTRYLIRWSRNSSSHLVLSMASHPAFSTEGTKSNWKIECVRDGFKIGNTTFSDLNSLLAHRGMVAPFFRPCASLLWSIADPEHSANTCLSRMPLNIPSDALETDNLGPTPAVDEVCLSAGIAAFEWDIDEAVVLFEDVYRRNRSAIDLREILSCARSLGNLGNAQQKKGKGEVAVRYFEECLQLLRQLLIGRVAVEVALEARKDGSHHDEHDGVVNDRPSDRPSGGPKDRSNEVANEAVAVDNWNESNSSDDADYYDGDVRHKLKKKGKKRSRRKSTPVIKLRDLIRKEANIVANLCVVTSHILQVTPGEVSTDERKAQIAVQFASCLGEELGIAGNQNDDETRKKMLDRHELLLKSTGIELSWVSGLAGKLLEDGFQMKEDGKVLSAAHMFFQAVCISRLTSQPTLEALAMEALAGIDDIPIVIFLRIWSTCGKEYWPSGISLEGMFVTPAHTFCCSRAGGLAARMDDFNGLETKTKEPQSANAHHRKKVTSTILRASSPMKSQQQPHYMKSSDSPVMTV